MQRVSLVLPLICILAGCGVRASSNESDYVGEYVFRPATAPPERFAGLLILKPDHEALEIRFDRAARQVRTTATKWYLSRSTQQNVVIGDFSRPVEGPPSAIRLGVNDDLGQYYEKVR